MRKSCYICGKIKKVLYEFKYLDYVFSYTLEICHGCGEHVKQNIEGLRLVQIRKKAHDSEQE